MNHVFERTIPGRTTTNSSFASRQQKSMSSLMSDRQDTSSLTCSKSRELHTLLANRSWCSETWKSIYILTHRPLQTWIPLVCLGMWLRWCHSTSPSICLHFLWEFWWFFGRIPPLNSPGGLGLLPKEQNFVMWFESMQTIIFPMHNVKACKKMAMQL